VAQGRRISDVMILQIKAAQKYLSDDAAWPSD
jgi:hypothetical protein